MSTYSETEASPSKYALNTVKYGLQTETNLLLELYFKEHPSKVRLKMSAKFVLSY